MSGQVVCRGGLRFLEALALVFISLRLTDQITWSWVWVLAPLWIPFLWDVGRSFWETVRTVT